MIAITNLIDRSIEIHGISIKKGQEQVFNIKVDNYLRRLEELKIITLKQILEPPKEVKIKKTNKGKGK